MAEDQKPKIYIVIYSLYHHIYKLATKVAEGVEANGCQVKIFQVEETLSPEILEKMHAPAKPDLPVITAAQLAEADGLLFGVPTRFGTPPAQIKRLLDATGSLWAKGTLSQKFAGFFFSTASSHGGQETTALTTVTYLAHHGINYVPFGFANASLFDNSKVIGGSAYGAGTISNGDGTRIPIEEELEMAKNQGENFAKLLVIYHRGMKHLAGFEKQPIHAADQTPATTTTTSEEVGTKAGAVAAAAGGAGLVAAGTKAALQSDQGATKQGVQSDPTAKPGATTTQSDPAAKQGAATAQSDPTAKQGVTAAQSDPTARQAAAATQSDTAAKQAPTQGATKGQPTATQSGPAAKQGTADGAKQGLTTSQPKGSLESTPPDSSTQPPNRPLTPQQEQAQQQQQRTQPTQEKKKKSKSFWFCCGNSNDLD